MALSPRAADSQQRILRRTLLTTLEIWQTCLPDDLVVFILKFLSFEEIWTQCLRVSRRMWWLCCQRQSQLFATIRRPFTEFGRQEDYRLVFLLETVGEHIVTLAIEATFSGTTADFSESLALEENCQRLKHFIAPIQFLTRKQFNICSSNWHCKLWSAAWFCRSLAKALINPLPAN